MKKGYIITGIVSVVVGLLIGWLLTRHFYSKDTPQPVEIHDTIVRTAVDIDTLYLDRLRYVEVYDTAVIFEHDTVTDTIYMNIPIEHREYRDTFGTDSAKVAVNIKYHGFRAGIDTASYMLDVIPQVHIKRNGWGQFVGVGVSAGYGIGMGVTPRFEPFIGVSVVYGFGYHWSKK